MSKTKLNEKGYVVFEDSGIFVHRYNAMKKYNITKEELDNYEVHHIDGNKTNNQWDNLLLITPEDHKLIESHLRVIKNKSIISFAIIAISLLMNFTYLLIRKDQYLFISIILLIVGIYLFVLPANTLRKLLFKINFLEKHKNNLPLK